MFMRSFENQIHDSISTKTVSPRLMPDVQYVYIQKFAKCFLIFENPFIILKGIIFINSISMESATALMPPSTGLNCLLLSAET